MAARRVDSRRLEVQRGVHRQAVGHLLRDQRDRQVVPAAFRRDGSHGPRTGHLAAACPACGDHLLVVDDQRVGGHLHRLSADPRPASGQRWANSSPDGTGFPPAESSAARFSAGGEKLAKRKIDVVGTLANSVAQLALDSLQRRDCRRLVAGGFPP